MKRRHQVSLEVQREIVSNFRRVVDDVCTEADVVTISFVIDDECDTIRVTGLGRNGSASLGLCSACFWSIEKHEAVARHLVAAIIASVKQLDEMARDIAKIAKGREG